MPMRSRLGERSGRLCFRMVAAVLVIERREQGFPNSCDDSIQDALRRTQSSRRILPSFYRGNDSALFGGNQSKLDLTGNDTYTFAMDARGRTRICPPGYEINLLHILGLMELILGGAGPLSIDALRSRRPKRHLDKI
jgi:hypothetical protein